MRQKDLKELLKRNNYEVRKEGDKVSLFHNGEEKKASVVIIYSIYIGKGKSISITLNQLKELAEEE